jgi:DNA polymerase-3 subunit epsilon
MNLTLQRPFAVFDLETTGINVTQDRIIEIAIIKIHPDGNEEEYYKRVNPTIPIPKESTEIHHISDEDVKDAPTFAQLADELAAFIGDADLAGYNSNKFDIPVLAEEFLRCNHPFDIRARKFVDVQNIFHKMEQRTLAAAYQFYCQQPMENAHNALYDTRVTLDVFRAQLQRYEDLAKHVDGLAEFSRQGNVEWHDFAGRLAKTPEGKIIYNFGKHKGKTVEEISDIEPGYYGWMLDADFPLYTKQLLREEMERIKLSKRASRPQEQHQHNAPRPQQQRPQQPELSMEEKLAALKNKFGK